MGKSDEPVYVSRIEDLLRLKSEMAGEKVRISDLADFVGVSRQTIQTWISPRGIKNLPTAAYQRKLEQFFGVSWDKIWKLKAVDKFDTQDLPAVDSEGQPVAVGVG